MKWLLDVEMFLANYIFYGKEHTEELLQKIPYKWIGV